MQKATFKLFKGKNPAKPIGRAVFFGQSQKKALANGRRYLRNVAAGFYDDEGVFHPIRASYDYSAKRAGEKKPRPHKRTRATSRQAGYGGRLRNKRKSNLNFGQRMARLRKRR